MLASDHNLQELRKNVEFMLSHFNGQHELFPRTIMTSKLPFQKRIDYEASEQLSIDNMIRRFEDSGFIDCKINAFPYNHQHDIDFDIKNRTAPTLIMIDLDQRDVSFSHVDSRKRLDLDLNKTIKKMDSVFHGESNPTVLLTGNGYHIYQPIEPINGDVLERYQTFFEFLPYLDGVDLTTEFLRFAEKFLSLGKSDPNHNPSIKSCLLRIPGSINSKNNALVEIIQRWDGHKPPIQYITPYFMSHLIQKRINKIKRQESTQKNLFRNSYNKIEWIERLLKVPIEDYRKVTVALILVPYLIVVRRCDENTTFNVVREWLSACCNIRSVSPDDYQRIKYSIKTSNRTRIPPMSIRTIKVTRPDLFALLRKRNVVNQSF